MVLPGLNHMDRKIALDENRYYDRSEMVNVIAASKKLTDTYNIPFRCGEFGVIEYLSTEMGDHWLEDVFSVFEE
jgi:hypothetical protein